MPVLLLERLKSRKTTIARDSASSSVKLEYICLGTMDDAAVDLACKLGIPPTYRGMFLQSYSYDPQGGGVWYAEGNYSPIKPKEPGESVYAFETAGGTAHVTVSKETVDSYSWIEGEEPPDFGGMIGVNGDSVEGVDIHVPVFNFSETHYIPVALITAAYKLLLFKLTSTTNIDPWHGLDACEVLFLGAQGSLRGSDFWEISYKFAGSPNRDDLEIGSPENLVLKRGWEYVWTRYQERVDTTAKALVKKPASTYVERVYDEGDLSLLGIGV